MACLLALTFSYICVFSILFTGAHSTAAYIELIGKIELINKLICFGIFSSAGLFLLTVVPYTYARYYIFHMEEDSFYLFVPAWFVFTK